MIALLARILRFVLLLFVVRLALRALAAWLRGSPPAAQPEGQVGGGDLVRDRVCNTFLPRDRALSVVRAGREEHFCSAACRDRAAADLSQAS